MRDTIFFDLDGTLLPLDMNVFIPRFFGMITSIDFSKVKNGNFDAKRMQQAFEYMMHGSHPDQTNENALFAYIEEKFDVPKAQVEPLFLDFYKNQFDHLQVTAKKEPLSQQIVRLLKEKGYKLVLATNPAFPQLATFKRMDWAGLNREDFEHITTFENSNYTKPQLNYYRQILNRLNISAKQCYMVGNSVKEDLCALDLGFEVFLLTNYLIGEIDEAPKCEKGNYSDLKIWAEKLPPV